MSGRNAAGVVLVTGSSGFIGRAAVRRLARNFSMVGFDREGGNFILRVKLSASVLT